MTGNPPDNPDQPGAARVRPYLPGAEQPPPPQQPAPHEYQQTPDHGALRPYLLTGGRVSSTGVALEIEAQVVTTELGQATREGLAYEKRDIVELCDAPLSVAETAARLGLHIGVVRVLVGDLVALGHLAVLRPEVGLASDVETIEKVIRGLQAIS
ncbi:MAG: DUF742 domain-containing protein [Pseudonocardiales bacterium]|nr:DUF742 domain-containing protein [Pseudonocardiales bacterium]